MPEQLEHVDSIQGRVEQEVVDCLDVLLLWLCQLHSTAQHFGQTNEGLDVSTIACTLHSADSHEGTSNSPVLFLGVHADNLVLRFQLPVSGQYMQTPQAPAGVSRKDRSGRIAWQCGRFGIRYAWSIGLACCCRTRYAGQCCHEDHDWC